MLGLYTHFDGFFVVNGQPVTPQLFDTLRQHTVWVSPNVKLWNRTLLENLQYGAAKPFRSLEETLTKSSLNTLIERLPKGCKRFCLRMESGFLGVNDKRFSLGVLYNVKMSAS
jgi:ATP-binding cassette subfamily B protein